MSKPFLSSLSVHKTMKQNAVIHISLSMLPTNGKQVTIRLLLLYVITDVTQVKLCVTTFKKCCTSVYISIRVCERREPHIIRQRQADRQSQNKTDVMHISTHTYTHLPSTANISVFVKCLYKVSFTTLRRRRSVRVVWIRLEKMWLQSRKLVQIKTTNCPPNSVTALASCCPVVDTHTTSPQTATLYFTPYQDASYKAVFWSICTPVSVQQNLQTHSTEGFFENFD